MKATVTDRELAFLQFRDNMRWMIDKVALDGGHVVVSGWVLANNMHPDGYEILLNGEPFEAAELQLASDDLLSVFPGVAGIDHARFSCRSPLSRETWRSGFARFDFFRPGDSLRQMDRSAWYILDPELEPALPSARNVSRVIGGDLDSYRRGGATVARRLSNYLLELTGKGIGEQGAVLDWGCGAGRVGRYIAPAEGCTLDGADIDPLNLLWTKSNLPNYRRLLHVGGMPPIGVIDAAYDLIFGISVFTHLIEDVQEAWLAELKRLVRPGGMVLVSVHGPTEMYLARAEPDFLARVESEGLVVTGVNPDIPGYVAGEAYYVDTYHSPSYIREVWGRYFEIVEILPSLAAFQDIVVMRAS